MWRITTRGFTLQELLVLVAMNIATAVIAAEKRGPGASQNNTKRSIYAI
jgi:Tfp pilus assembly protein FimT